MSPPNNPVSFTDDNSREIVENIYWYPGDKPLKNLMMWGSSSNFYVIDQGNEIWLIDVGGSGLFRHHFLKKHFKQDGLDYKKITKIFLTHTHPDHTTKLTKFPKDSKVTVYFHEKEEPLYRGRNRGFWKFQYDTAGQFRSKLFFHFPRWFFLAFGVYSMGVSPKPELHPYTLIKDGDIFIGQKYTLKTIHTPGHTPGHCCFYIESDELMFSGDFIETHYNNSPSLILLYANYKDYYNSSKKFLPYRIKTLCTGHMVEKYADTIEPIDKIIKTFCAITENYKKDFLEFIEECKEKNRLELKFKDFLKLDFTPKLFVRKKILTFLILRDLLEEGILKQERKKFLVI